MYKNSRNRVIYPLLLAVAVVVGLIVGQSMGRSTAESQFRRVISHLRPPYDKLNSTMSLIQNEYIDSLDMDSITEQVLPLLVQQLDPHSVYIPSHEMQQANEPIEGKFEGIGVVFNMGTDTIVVMNGGVIQQIGTPEEIYNEPKNVFVADFIGESNIVDGIMNEDFKVTFSNHTFTCVDKGFKKGDKNIEIHIPERGPLNNDECVASIAWAKEFFKKYYPIL